MLAGLTAIIEEPKAALANVLSAWSEVLKLVEETPQFPIAHIAELVDRFAPVFADQPAFRPFRDQVEELVEARSGQHAVAARSYRRALAQFEAGNRLAAIDELQKAKRGWFSGDEMTKSVMAMLLLAEAYAALNLHAAARYYAAGAAYIAVNSDDEDVRALTPLASLMLAGSFLGAGEGMSFLKAFGAALQVFGVLTPNPEGPARNEIDEGLMKAAIFVHVARPLDSERTGLPRFGTLVSRPGWGDYWVPRVQAWANARDADVHYVDNCWLRVAVSAADLMDFLQRIDQPGNTWVQPLLQRVDQNDSYVIEAEEF